MGGSGVCSSLDRDIAAPVALISFPVLEHSSSALVPQFRQVLLAKTAFDSYVRNLFFF
jgi:hypothetical protein